MGEKGKVIEMAPIFITGGEKQKPAPAIDSSKIEGKAAVSASNARLDKVVHVMAPVTIELIPHTGDKKVDRQIDILNKLGVSNKDYLSILLGDDSYLAGLGTDMTDIVKSIQKLAGMSDDQQDGLLGPITVNALYNFWKKDPTNEFFTKVPGRVAAIAKVRAQVNGSQDSAPNS